MNNEYRINNLLVKIGMAGLILNEGDIIQLPSKLKDISDDSEKNNFVEDTEMEYFEFNLPSMSMGQEEFIPELFASALMNIKSETVELNGIGTLIERSGTRYKYIFNER